MYFYEMPKLFTTFFIYLDFFNNVLFRSRIDLASAKLWVRHSAVTHSGDVAWQLASCCTNHAGYRTQRKVIRFNFVVLCQLPEHRSLTIMATYGSLDHTFVCKMIHSLILPVSRTAAEDHCEVRRLACLFVSSAKSRHDFFCTVLRNKTANCDCISTFHEMDCIVSAHHFVAC